MSTNAEIQLVMAQEIMREGGMSCRRRSLDDVEGVRSRETECTVHRDSRTGMIDWTDERKGYKFDL